MDPMQQLNYNLGLRVLGTFPNEKPATQIYLNIKWSYE